MGKAEENIKRLMKMAGLDTPKKDPPKKKPIALRLQKKGSDYCYLIKFDSYGDRVIFMEDFGLSKKEKENE